MSAILPVPVMPLVYHDTEIADLLAYHNLGMPYRRRRSSQANLLVGMCMDYRQRLRIPDNFAYVMRTAGANVRGLESQISFAVAVGGVRAIAIIGHDQCRMGDLSTKRDAFVSGLINDAGWERHVAEAHFKDFASRFEIADPVKFACAQARHLRQQYPRITVAPLLYQHDDERLYLIDEDESEETGSMKRRHKAS